MSVNLIDKGLTVQKYLKKPLLLSGFKFDFRVYVVVVGTDPLEAFVCDEGLARFCTSKYKQPKRSNMGKAYMHLTNYSLNKNSDKYKHTSKYKQVDGKKVKEEVDILSDTEGSKRTLTALFNELERKKIDVVKVRKNILVTCSRTM